MDLAGHPSFRVEAPPDDLPEVARTTFRALATLGVEVERPDDLDTLIDRLRSGAGPGASPSVARDLVVRRIVAAANRTLATRDDERRVARVASIGGRVPDVATWVVVRPPDRRALAAAGVVLEDLAKAVFAQLAPLVLGLAAVLLAVLALARGDRVLRVAALVLAATWLVARLALRGRAPYPR